MKNFSESIRNSCNLIAETFDLNVFYINPLGEVIYENFKNHLLNPLYKNQKEKFFNPLNFRPSKVYSAPVIKKSAFSEKYILLSVAKDKEFTGTVIIGPILSYSLSKELIDGIVNDSRAFFYREKVIHYYNSLPVISLEQQKNISLVAFHLLNNYFINPTSIINDDDIESTDSNKIEKLDLVVSENLQSGVFHNDRLFEKKVLYFIKEGKVENLQELSVIKEEEVASILSKSSYLRSIKNHIITLITLVSRASIEGGLNEEIAFSLHDNFIQQLEELNRLDNVRLLAGDILYTFANKVKQIKEERYSKTIINCKDFIYEHIYEEISHDDIARKVNLSPKYLSVLFKKEVGITVSDYIQQSKIEEAKKLLAYSKTSISEICVLLNFNDQSYFTKVFKKVVGVTPKKYRDTQHLLKN